MDGSGTRAEAPGPGVEGAPLPAEEIRDLFSAFEKALRAVQLYERDNPVYQRFLGELRAAFARVWERAERLEILVEESRLLCEWEEVYRNDEPNDSLAFLFYRDGIRAFTVTPGLEDEELEPLLGAIHSARRVQRTQDDLLTLLWGLDLQFFDYSYVDFLAEGVEVPSGGEGSGDLRPVFEEEVGVSAESGTHGPPAPPPGVVNREDFNPTLYSLEPSEVEALRQELRGEMERDVRRDVLFALFDRLEEPERFERQMEILEILGMLLPNFLARGELASAARVLEELHELRGRDGILPPEARERTDRLLNEVSSPSAVEQLVRSLEAGAVGADAAGLSPFLKHLQPRALEPLARAVGEMEEGARASALREALQVLAAKHPSAVVGLLSSHDPAVVMGAVRLVGKLRIESGASELAELAEHESAGVRVAVAEVAASMGNSVVLEAVVRLLSDSQRDVRLAAARTLGRARYRPAARQFREILQGRTLRRADVTEQTTLFEGYGRLGDPEAVGFLDRFLNGRTRMLRKEPSEIRASAALALGKVRTADARTSLEKARDEEDPVVRSAVNRALREDGD